VAKTDDRLCVVIAQRDVQVEGLADIEARFADRVLLRSSPIYQGHPLASWHGSGRRTEPGAPGKLKAIARQATMASDLGRFRIGSSQS
jgi:hypothetical protein